MKVLQSKGTLLINGRKYEKLSAGMTKYFQSGFEDISYLARWGLNNRAVLLVQWQTICKQANEPTMQTSSSEEWERPCYIASTCRNFHTTIKKLKMYRIKSVMKNDDIFIMFDGFQYLIKFYLKFLHWFTDVIKRPIREQKVLKTLIVPYQPNLHTHRKRLCSL